MNRLSGTKSYCYLSYSEIDVLGLRHRKFDKKT